MAPICSAQPRRFIPHRRFRSGLTLLELMVVLVILAIVATVAVQSLQPQEEKERRLLLPFHRLPRDHCENFISRLKPPGKAVL